MHIAQYLLSGVFWGLVLPIIISFSVSIQPTHSDSMKFKMQELI
jgi:hypothetical protein